MSATTQAAPLGRGPSPLASNNPFRNRIGSSPTGSGSPVLAPYSQKPVSTNPFLDNNEIFDHSPPKVNAEEHTRLQIDRYNDNTVDVFARMDLQNKPHSPTRMTRPKTSGGPGASRRPENMPPGRFPLQHRPSMSEEDRRRQQTRSKPSIGTIDPFSNPPRLANASDDKARRNSESSVRDPPTGLLDPDEEKRRRERKQRDARRQGMKPKTASRKLDLIDRLDVTSIYGTGLFHHDGPFDACNPHRNRKGSRQAPMQAFPVGSANMNIGGSGPVNKKLDLDQFHGRGQEAHIDFNEAKGVVDADAEYFRQYQANPGPDFNPGSKVEPVHGHETVGLGTSTFLEGAPASRIAIQRRESENEAAQQANNGLARKKSFAQRIRAVRPPRANNDGRVNSPDLLPTPTTPLATSKSESNANPFFQEYDQELERKGASIAFSQDQVKPGRARAPSSPKRGLGLERRMTTEDTTTTTMTADEPKSSTGGGFLSRVKSLKTRGRAKAERRDTSG